jgi:hypothetical protein
LTNKRRRREDEKIIRREAERGLPYLFVSLLELAA